MTGSSSARWTDTRSAGSEWERVSFVQVCRDRKKGRLDFLTGFGTYDGEDFSRVIFALSKNQCLRMKIESRSVVEAQKYDVDVTVCRMVEICYGLMSNGIREEEDDIVTLYLAKCYSICNNIL